MKISTMMTCFEILKIVYSIIATSLFEDIHLRKTEVAECSSTGFQVISPSSLNDPTKLWGHDAPHS